MPSLLDSRFARFKIDGAGRPPPGESEFFRARSPADSWTFGQKCRFAKELTRPRSVDGFGLDQLSVALLRRQRLRLVAHVDTLDSLATPDDAAGRGFDFAQVFGGLTEVAAQIGDALLEQS